MKQNSNMYNITDITVEFDSIDLKYEMFDSLLSKYLINFHQFLSENKKHLVDFLSSCCRTQ